MTYEELRKKYNKFVYEKYEINDEWDWWNITYFFNIEWLTTFTPSIKIDKKNIKNQNIDNNFVEYLVFHIWLVELISYWKCCCPENVEIKAWYIDEDQIKWFKKMYFYGLGEFFYTNGIEVDEESFMKITAPLCKGGKGGWYIPYNPLLKDKARDLRNNSTHAEKKLRYDFLSTYDYKFQRQKPIDEYVVDFFCNELKLIIEVDWDTHRSDEEIKHDELRTKKLESLWFKVIRFRNDEIYHNFDEVCNVIKSIEPPLSPFIRGTHLRPPFEGGVGEVWSSNKPPLSPFIRGTTFQWQGNLICIWWWKDSNVTLELLKWMDNDTFILNPNDVTLECSKIAGHKNPRIMKRNLDLQIVELNQKWFLNGHTPFNALLAFLTYLVAYLGNKKYIVLSNESSANESNVRGLKVNHQYSKSFEFENDFNEYTKKYFWIWIKYFSFLRPLLEIQIAQLFSKFGQYHQVFKSCNVWSKSKPRKRCCNCPKCLFVFTILSPFLYREKLVDIFGQDLFENKELLQTFIDLTWNSDNKPFECVGTYDEVNYAIALTIKKLDWNLPYLLQYYVDHFEVKDYDLLNYFNEENNLDPEFLEILKKGLSAK